MKQSQVNHLRRLLGWVRCEIGQTPEEFVETMRQIAPAFPNPSADTQARLVAYHDKARSIPLYVRAAIKALEPLVRNGSEVVDADQAAPRALTRTAPLASDERGLDAADEDRGAEESA